MAQPDQAELNLLMEASRLGVDVPSGVNASTTNGENWIKRQISIDDKSSADAVATALGHPVQVAEVTGTKIPDGIGPLLLRRSPPSKSLGLPVQQTGISQNLPLGTQIRTLGNQVSQLGLQTPSLANPGPRLGLRAPALGTQAPALGTQAPALGTQAPELGTRAPSLGTRAPSLGTQIQPLGTRAPELGTRAPTLGTQIQPLGTRAPSLGTQIQPLGTRAPSLGTQIQPLGTRAPSLGTQAPTLGTQPPTLGAQTPTLGTQPPTLGTRPPALGTQAPGLGTRTPKLGTRDPGLGTRTPTLGTQAPTLGTQTPRLGTQILGTQAPTLGTQTPTLGTQDRVYLETMRSFGLPQPKAENSAPSFTLPRNYVSPLQQPLVIPVKQPQTRTVNPIPLGMFGGQQNVKYTTLSPGLTSPRSERLRGGAVKSSDSARGFHSPLAVPQTKTLVTPGPAIDLSLPTDTLEELSRQEISGIILQRRIEAAQSIDEEKLKLTITKRYRQGSDETYSPEDLKKFAAIFDVGISTKQKSQLAQDILDEMQKYKM